MAFPSSAAQTVRAIGGDLVLKLKEIFTWLLLHGKSSFWYPKEVEKTPVIWSSASLSFLPVYVQVGKEHFFRAISVEIGG